MDSERNGGLKEEGGERERERVRERERGERGEIGEEPPSRLVSDSFCDQGDIFTYDAIHRY